MNEIKSEFAGAKGKKEKQFLLDNLESIVKQLNDRIDQSGKSLQELRADKEIIVEEFNKCLQREKEHFNKVKEFEAECDKNELLMLQIKEIKKERQRKETA
jgi:hypothetical protein